MPWIAVILILFWGAIAYLIVHPPGIEDIPWIVAGVSIGIILKIYGRGRSN